MTKSQKRSFLGEIEMNYGGYGYLRSYSARIFAERAGLAKDGGMRLVDWSEAGLAFLAEHAR